MKTKFFIILTALLMLVGNAQASYYWYVGTTEPTESTNPATEPGWTSLDSKPDKIDVWKESEGWVDVQWYIAAPAEWGFTTTVNGYEVGGWTKTTVTIQGVKYNVWKCQVLTDTANVTLANIGNSNPTYYTLTYLVDGAVYKTYQLAEGAAITPEPEPKKEGYTFSGWDNVPKTMPAKDVTVTGKFTINKYKLKYIVDGTEYKKYDVEYGAAITPEPEPKKDGYVFSGWDYVPKTMPAYDVTVTGSFTKKEAQTYTLTYKVDGAVYKTYQLAEGTAITPEPEPKKEGYTFSGWDYVPKTMPAYDVTVKGSFTKNSVPVDDSVIAEIDWTAQSAYYKDVWYSDPAEVSVKKGKGLIINCTQTNPKKAQYWEPQVPIIVNIPQIKKGGRYVVKFDVNAPADGEIRLDLCSWDGTDASQDWIGTVTAGDNDIIASFLNYPKNCTDAFIFYQCGKIPGNHIIKKVQVLQLSDSNYSLTYKVDGIVYKTYILKEGATITPEPDPKKDGYVFSGWDNVPKTMPAKDVTVNGSFTKSSAINSVSMDQTDALIFDIQGNRLNYPRKGVNIIRYKDGKTKKVVIR